MHELEYQLVKEDYKNWIHWNVLRNESKKMKLFSLVIYIGFVILYLGGSINSAKGNMAALIPAVFMVLLVGAAMFYTTSHHNQERLIWKKSGLKRLERDNNFPVVNLALNDTEIVMTVRSQDVIKEYSYTEIKGIQEIERLFLLEATDKTWQFVAKSAFSSREEMDEFRAFMEEKIADAKENPDKYEKRESSASNTVDLEKKIEQTQCVEGRRPFAAEADNGEEEGAIQPMDTSHMGKIGKMAHIMAARAALEDESSGENSGSEEKTMRFDDTQMEGEARQELPDESGHGASVAGQ